MKTETDSKQDEAKNGGSARDCPDSAGSAFKWAWADGFSVTMGTVHKHKAFGFVGKIYAVDCAENSINLEDSEGREMQVTSQQLRDEFIQPNK